MKIIQKSILSIEWQLYLLTFLGLAFTPLLSLAASLEEMETVTLQLKWLHQFQFAGYYAAIEQGYYRDVGLNVVLREGAPGMDFSEEVVSGRAEYGVNSAGLLLDRQQGKAVVVLAAVFQHSPEAFFVRKDSSISNPHDFIGKTVMMKPYGSVVSRVMLFNEGIDGDRLKVVNHTWNIDDLIEGRVDISSGYITDRPFLLQEKGVAYSTIRPLSYGVDFYGDCLFTSEEEINRHPRRVKDFRAASLKGWAYAMENPKEIVDLILEKYSTRLSRDALLFEAKAMRELILPKLVQLGHMNPGRWRHIGDSFVQLKMMSADYSLKGFIYDPDPQPDSGRIVAMVWVLAGVVLIIGLVLMLVLAFNRKLNSQVGERTAHLLREVAERKRAEKNLKASEGFLQTIVDNIPHMICVKDANDLRFVSLNVAGEELLGIAHQEVIGKNDYDLCSREDADLFTAKDREVLSGECLMDIPEEAVETREQGIRLLHTKKIPIFGEDGRATFLLGISEDITEKKRIAEETKLLTARLRQAQKMESIGTLAGGIAHDFNNILTAICGYAELTEVEVAELPTARKYIAEVLLGADRARELVKQILAFSRKGERDLRPLSLPQILEETHTLLRASLPSTIEITQEIDPHCESIRADPTEIHQVIMNLCTNAYHAMRETGGLLAISVQPFEVDAKSFPDGSCQLKLGPYLELSISDSGKGMAAETLGRIFEPYYTTKEKGEGTGLGLAVAHGIINSLHGDIRVQSVLGEGTTFSLYLPTVAPQIEEVTSKDEPVVLRGGRERVLIVDDDVVIVEMLRQMLTSLGYRVSSYSDSVACLAAFQAHPADFDVLISDITMPRMAGDQLVEEVLKIRPELAVILCTGFSDRMDEYKAREMGVGVYLLKPVGRKELAKALHRVLAKGGAVQDKL